MWIVPVGAPSDRIASCCKWHAPVANQHVPFLHFGIFIPAIFPVLTLSQTHQAVCCTSVCLCVGHFNTNIYHTLNTCVCQFVRVRVLWLIEKQKKTEEGSEFFPFSTCYHVERRFFFVFWWCLSIWLRLAAVSIFNQSFDNHGDASAVRPMLLWQ